MVNSVAIPIPIENPLNLYSGFDESIQLSHMPLGFGKDRNWIGPLTGVAWGSARITEGTTFGGIAMAVTERLVRIQEKGQITLPADVRRRLGLKKGDLVSVVETPEGVLITSRAIVAMTALAGIGEALREQGLTLEDMMESGRAIRGELFDEWYGNKEQ
jgi:AbrB family looped-hinge helix DNA binding protein